MENEKQNYTEKITLRLTPQDKDSYQIEADTKKMPLTTLLRNKLNGVEVDEVLFESKLISRNTSGFNRERHQSNLKIQKIADVIIQAEKFIELPSRTSAEFIQFIKNPVQFVTKVLYDKHSVGITFNISEHKLLDLMEIDLTPLNNVANLYSSQVGNIAVDENGEFVSPANIENHSYYTKNEGDNERLKLAQDIINCYKRSIDYNIHITIGTMNNGFGRILSVGHNSELIPNKDWVLGK